MIIDHSREKLINAAIYFAKNTKYCGITKLMKLLAILDFTHFKQTGRPVSGQIYYTWKRGPVPKSFYEEINKPIEEQPEDISESISISEGIPVLPKKGKKKDRIFRKITTKKDFDPTHFTFRELELLKNIAYVFRDAPTDKMVRYTHLKSEPWRKTKSINGMYVPINYMSAVDRSPDSLSKEEIKERIKDREMGEIIFKK
jgi:uncharacterized phage-associated protein